MTATFTRRRFTRSMGLLGAAALFTPALMSKASAAPPRLTVASLLGRDKPETLVWVKFGELVEKELPGQFNFNVVPNAALGGEKEVAEGLRLGSIQGSLFTVSALSSWVPETQILDLPFVFRDAGHLQRVLDGDTGQELAAKLAAQNFITTGYINYGARHLLGKSALVRPAQLRGLRMRVIQSPLHTELWKAFGAIPTAIPITETYNALSTGVVDAMDLTIAAYAGFKLYEVVPYVIETGHIWAAGVVCFSSSFWNGLNADQKTVFGKAGKEAAAYFDRLVKDEEDASIALIRKSGGKIVQPEDRPAWEEGARKVWDIVKDTVGGMAKIEKIRSLA
jgi:tripartite ATP-independent transporter DctP family solute receptor